MAEFIKYRGIIDKKTNDSIGYKLQIFGFITIAKVYDKDRDTKTSYSK